MRTLFFALALSSSAQTVFLPASTQINADLITVKISFPSRFPPRSHVVTGAPYSADQISESTPVSGSGTLTTTDHMVRDSQGRTRVEWPLPAVSDGATGSLSLIEIDDPIAGYAYLLDGQNKVAHRIAIPPPGQNRASKMIAAPGVPKPPSPHVALEILGTQTIEGVVTEGTRQTFTWPPGSRANDQVVETKESWLSEELKLEMVSRSTSPLSGEKIVRIVHLSRAEPDASLFQPFAGFSIVDEKDPFEITLPRP